VLGHESGIKIKAENERDGREGEGKRRGKERDDSSGGT